MLATEHAARLLARLAAIAQGVDDAIGEAEALAALVAGSGGGAGDDAARWLPGIAESLARIRLECLELRFSTRALRAALPAAEALQPRLL